MGATPTTPCESVSLKAAHTAIKLSNSLEDYISEENPVRVVEVFIDELGSNFAG